MRIIIAHNYYGDYATGGEGNSAHADEELLRRHGHEVRFFQHTNNELLKGTWNKIRFPKRILFNKDLYREATALFKEFKPDILHVNNYKYYFTPAIFQAAHDCGVKTIVTLRNYRLVCPCALLCCNGKTCEKCVKGFPYRTLWKPCTPYEHSFVQRLLQLYFYLGTSQKIATGGLIDAFVSLTPFAKTRYIKKGIPEDKIFIKPNFMETPPFNPEEIDKRRGAVCIGRVSSEKGIDILLEAWQKIDYPLTIIGDGPLLNELKAKAPETVTFVGNQPHAKSMEYLANARFMVFSSICYEGFPRTVLEAMAYGVPVVASDLGARKDVVHHGVNGFLYPYQDPAALRESVQKMIADDELCRSMSQAARETFLNNFTPEINYKILIDIYEKVLGQN